MAHLPENCEPYTTYYSRFVRWQQARIWDQIMDALTVAHDGGSDNRYIRSACAQHGARIARQHPYRHFFQTALPPAQ
jgi:transposase